MEEIAHTQIFDENLKVSDSILGIQGHRWVVIFFTTLLVEGKRFAKLKIFPNSQIEIHSGKLT